MHVSPNQVVAGPAGIRRRGEQTLIRTVELNTRLAAQIDPRRLRVVTNSALGADDRHDAASEAHTPPALFRQRQLKRGLAQCGDEPVFRCELGILVAADPDFPPLASWCRFLGRLAWQIGPRQCWRYLRFALAYQRFMQQPRHARAGEMRGLWLMVAPRGDAVGLGRRLVRQAMAAVAPDGYTLMTGMIDGRDARLARFYRRIGFRVAKPVAFRGQPAARITLRYPLGEER